MGVILFSEVVNQFIEEYCSMWGISSDGRVPA